MLYDTLKIIHVLNGGLIFMALGLSIHTWQTVHDKNQLRFKLQAHTFLLLLPLILLQLLLGFTLMSLKEVTLHQIWVLGSIISFMSFVMTWLTFTYSAQTNFKKITLLFFTLSMLTLCSMIFFMANKP